MSFGNLFSDQSWLSPTSAISFSLFQSFFDGQPGAYFMKGITIFLAGTIIEFARWFLSWLMSRLKLFQFSIEAQFSEGDPAHEWICHLLAEEQVWTHSRQFQVSAVSSVRKWTAKINRGIKDKRVEEHVEYTPTYQQERLFRWNGYWIAVVKVRIGRYDDDGKAGDRLYLTIYTRHMEALSYLIEEARVRYNKTNIPNVIVHTADREWSSYSNTSIWSSAKQKLKRPLDSVILSEGVLDSLIEDARDFLSAEDWFNVAGIPYRRGYLLYGPPGTGKSSTIHAIAGELGLEIYSLSLAASFVDDAYLERAVSAMQKHSILLLEDIDCAFPSRDGDEEEQLDEYGKRGSVTLSGLLNVLDGIGSQEGRILFATTNHIDKLDPALIRPGRIDRKIEYFLSSKQQISALFTRFYPPRFTTLSSEKLSENPSCEKDASLDIGSKQELLNELSSEFSDAVPENQFSTAELQGYLLQWRKQPELAVTNVKKWVQEQLDERQRKKTRDEEKEKKARRTRRKNRRRRDTSIDSTDTDTSDNQETSTSGNATDEVLVSREQIQDDETRAIS